MPDLAHPASGLVTPADIERFERAEPLERRIAPTVYELFQRSALEHGDRTALAMVRTGERDERPERLSYADLLAGITRTANLFAALGGPGVGVAYLLPSLFETHVTLWAAETAGFAVPLNPLLSPDHLADLIEASGAALLVSCGPEISPDIWSKARSLAERLPGVRIVCVSAPAGQANALDLADASSLQRGDGLTFAASSDPQDIVAYFHTGGTTGAPKLVAHTHRNQLAAALGVGALLGISADDVVTNGMPLFHVGGAIATSLAFFAHGATVLMLSPAGLRNPAMVRGFWRIAEAHGVTVLGAVPTALSAILDHPVDADLSGVRVAITGAAATPRVIADRFEAATRLRLHEILGMTETGGATAIDPSGGRATIGSVGLRLPYTRLALRRRTAEGGLGDLCAPGEPGVLVVSGPTVSPGYLDPDQRDGVFIDDALNSGDLARFDEDGKLFICGRAKDVIIRGGHNIDPALIESMLLRHPAVAAAAAVGQPDAYAGEVPVAYVVLKPGAAVTTEDLMSFAERETAERPALPKAIRVMDALPLTAVGKVYLPRLRLDAMIIAARARLEALVPGVAIGIEGHEREAGQLALDVVVPPEIDAANISEILSAFTCEMSVRGVA